MVRYFAFVIHGKNDSEPKPPGSYKLGTNPQKSIFVTFSQTTPKSNEEINIRLARQTFTSPFSKIYEIEVQNQGNIAVYGLKTELYYDDERVESYSTGTIPPYGKATKEIKVNYGFFGTKAPESVSVVAHGQSLKISTEATKIATLQIITILLFCIVILITIFFKNHILQYVQQLKGG